MSNWISLSDPSSGNSVVETSRHGYTIFEVRMGQKARFQLNVDRIRYLQSRRHMIYFVAQGIDNFGEETWLEWNNGPAPMALHEYFNHLNGGSEDYTPDTVRQIGRNYITAFKVGEDGRVDWNTPKYPSYEPKEKGHGVWLEGLYYYPEWNNMGAFIIGVEQPQVVSLFARVRNYANYDPDENFISEDTGSLQNVKYGETIDLHIETHRIIPGRYSAEVEILHQGTRVYNGKKRFPLENYANPNNPALEYNLEMKESLFVDPAWKQATGHPDGATQTYTVRFTFSPGDVLENRTEMDGGLAPGSPVVKEFDLEITTTIFDFILPKLGVTPQIVSVQEETLEPIEHEECRFTAIEVAVKDQDPVEILRENTEQGTLTANLVNPVIPVVAGNGDDKEVTIQLEGVNTEECGEDPSHHNNIFVYDEAVGEWSPEESGDKLVLKPKYEYPDGMSGVNSTSDVNVDLLDIRNVLEYIWPINDSLIQGHTLSVSTCRYTREINFSVYPDIKWELAVEFIVNQSNYRAVNMPSGNIFARHQEKSREAGYRRWLMNRRGRVPITIGVGLSAEWNNGNSKRSFTNEFADRIQLAGEMVANSVNILQEAINFARGVAQQTALPVGFDIRYPKFAIVGKWYLERIDNRTAANIVGEIGFGFKPLIGAEVVIDIIGAAIAMASYGATGNPAAARIINNFRRGLDRLGASVVFEASFYGELEIAVDALKIDAVRGIDMQGKSTIGGKMGVTIVLSINADIGQASGANFVPIDVSFRAAARAHGFFGGEVVLDSDEEGVFIQPTLKFSGITLSVLIEGEIGWWKSDFRVEEKVVDKGDLPLEKKYFTK
ncbi:hypothetical protein LS482_13940 [Sinomicrobium kalidii]|uniref:hypothetical protein n=1 Tax=Sinomicrobium kalidii TaxID=2900738 RepID=UPI001E397B2F|nr:hypothetical protein [Sinomicrobium kalidii]UGU14793.1 hypothetical protein LS482_13940 [Sinomicrobium kalidii]